MTAIRLFTDEDIYCGVAAILRNAGWDAVSTPEAGRRGESDEAQLEWAIRAGRAIVSFNVAHFTALHGRWLKRGQSSLRHCRIATEADR